MWLTANPEEDKAAWESLPKTEKQKFKKLAKAERAKYRKIADGRTCPAKTF